MLYPLAIGGKKMEILKIKNLRKTYGEGETKVEALKNINISVDNGTKWLWEIYFFKFNLRYR